MGGWGPDVLPGEGESGMCDKTCAASMRLWVRAHRMSRDIMVSRPQDERMRGRENITSDGSRGARNKTNTNDERYDERLTAMVVMLQFGPEPGRLT